MLQSVGLLYGLLGFRWDLPLLFCGLLWFAGGGLAYLLPLHLRYSRLNVDSWGKYGHSDVRRLLQVLLKCS